MQARKAASGDFGSCHSIIHFHGSQDGSSINEYKWDVPSPQQLLLYRKLSDIIYDVENSLTHNDTNNNNNNNDLSLQQVIDIIHDASAIIRKYISEYIEYLFNEKQRLELQEKSENDYVSNELIKLNQEIELLINCEYIWNIAEIFWIDSTESNNSILITLKFLDVMNKFRSPFNYDLMNNDNNIQFDSDKYWKLLYKNAIYGKLDVIINEIRNFSNDKISHFTKKLIEDLCINCPLFNCLNDDDENEDDENIIIPTKEDILRWKQNVKEVIHRITEETHRLIPLLKIFLGETDIISLYIDNNWLDWICGYLLYNTPWIDHKNELRSLLTLKTAFNQTKKGSIEWMFGCIMSKEYSSILYYVNKIFPNWFGPHLCYFLRRLDPNLIIEWPREQEINNNYNEYIINHPKMTIIEWIFEYYVEDLLFISCDSWIWLKNYLYFFKRRGISMLSVIFENIEIKSDKMAYLMLQSCNEFNLNDNVYNNICLRMAQKSYINNMQYGRITYWCCKCKKNKKNNKEIQEYFNKYISHLITNYLNSPEKYINILHDVCDNANIDEFDINNHIKTCKLLHLLSKLRDMYLCRYDLQKLDQQYLKQNQLRTKQKNKAPKTTPFTISRGRLIDELMKESNPKNKNLKNIADSFDIADTDDDDIRYPKLNGIHLNQTNQMILSSSDNDETGPFPKSVIIRNKKMEERASTDFLKELITPPRPTPSRNKKHSHRKSSHKQTIKLNKKRRLKTEIDDESKQFDIIINDNHDDDDDDDDIDNDDKMDELDKNYMIECCDIIVSYINYLIEIITTEIYDLSHFIRIIIFSLPMLSHKYSPNSITVNNILIITHKWYKIKFIKNEKKTGIKQFNNNEIKLIQEILAHLQSKVLATTYSGKNYAEIWKLQENQGMDQDNDQEEKQQIEVDEVEDQDIVDID